MAETEKLRAVAVFSMCINAALGSGFLIIPWVYLQMGYIISLGITIWFFLVNSVNAMSIVEAHSRTEVLLRMQDEGIPIPSLRKGKNKREQLVNYEKTLQENAEYYKPQITTRDIVMKDMIQVSLGKFWGAVYGVFLILCATASICAAGSVFGASMTRNVPLWYDTCDVYEYEGIINECRVIYLFWLAVFFVINLVLAIIGLENQRVIQILSTVLRISIVALMLISSIISIALDVPIREIRETDEGEGVKWEMIGISFSLIGFAAGYAPVIPSLNSLLINKKNANLIQLWVNLALTGLMILLGIIVSIALTGTDPPSMCTLAWSGYDAGIQPRQFWTYIIEYTVVLFPALNVLTSTPVGVVVTADNVATFFKTKTRSLQLVLRIVVLTIPMILCVLTHDLGLIGALGGLFNYFLVFGIGSMVHLASRAKVPTKSPFSGWHSLSVLAWINIGFATIGTLYTTYNLISK